MIKLMNKFIFKTKFKTMKTNINIFNLIIIQVNKKK